jgi:hypothetical protein
VTTPSGVLQNLAPEVASGRRSLLLKLGLDEDERKD